METFPKIHEKAIRARIDARSFEKGQSYFRAGAIFDTKRQGRTIKARCEGSQAEAYRVKASFDEKGITSAECSCPVGGGGHCKHVAALLLTWRERPEEFVEIEELEASLEHRSKPELIAMIKQMLIRDPDLEILLETPLPGSRKRQVPVSPDIYRRQADRAFRGYGSEWGSGSGVA